MSPTFGHEFLPELMFTLQRKGYLYPSEPYQDMCIILAGSRGIELLSGVKNPDNSFYESTLNGNPGDENLDNIQHRQIPTVAIEVGYKETRVKLSKDAVHLLLLTMGLINLVVTVNFEFVKGTEDQKLKSITSF